MTTQGMVVVEFSPGGMRIVHMHEWSACVARGLHVSPGDLWLYETHCENPQFSRNGVEVYLRSMSCFQEL